MKKNVKPIGGFFELELPQLMAVKSCHKKALLLSTGRACLNYIIKQIKPRVIYVPYYTCDTLIEPIRLNKTQFVFYGINDKLEIDSIVEPGKNDYIIYINYFGLKNKYIKKLIPKFGNKLIIDNTQAFFEGAYRNNWSFNSARKFFGVADGAYLYGKFGKNLKPKRNTSANWNHLVNRLIGNQAKAFKEFQRYERSLGSEIKSASLLSETILESINYISAANVRRRNFSIYSKAFSKNNMLKLTLDRSATPFAYPLCTGKKINREKLYKKNIFPSKLWDDVFNRKIEGFEFEKDLAEKMLVLPADHRYCEKDINLVIEAVKQLI